MAVAFSERAGLICLGCEEICETLAGTGVTALLGLATLVLFIQGGVAVRPQKLGGRRFDPRRVTIVEVG